MQAGKALCSAGIGDVAPPAGGASFHNGIVGASASRQNEFSFKPAFIVY